MTLTESEIIDLLAKNTKSEYEEDREKYIFSLNRRGQSYKLFLQKNIIYSLILNLSNKKVFEETYLHNDEGFEILVKEESEIPVRRLRDEIISLKSDDNEIEFELSPLSNEYLIWLLSILKEASNNNEIRPWFLNSPRLDRFLEEDDNKDFLDYIKIVFSRFLSLKVKSGKKIPTSQFIKYLSSFMFHLSYNIDIAIIPYKLVDEITRGARISRMRRSRLDELDAPRRIYNEELINQYVLAVSTENPVIQYLSYYHILEYFYESVYNDDLLDFIKNKITDPGFSYKRRKDIQNLVNNIKRSLQIRSQTITFSELDALKLVLKKFVNFEDLVNKLNDFDENLIEYYKSNKVQFSNGEEVNFTQQDDDQIISNLSKRIYSTRNAVVHSKAGEKSRYTPFKDDKQIVKEVPLLRFISEMLIIKESNVT